MIKMIKINIKFDFKFMFVCFDAKKIFYHVCFVVKSC